MDVYRGYTRLTNGQAHWRRANPVFDSATTVRGRDKRPLICLHMVPKSSRSFATLLPLLAKDREVLAPDLPGHGASDPPAGSHSVPGYARWLWELMDALEIAGSVDMLGYHTGSMVAVAAASLQPSRVGRIINISAPAFSSEELAHFRDYFTPIPLDKEGTRFRTMWQRVLAHAGPGMTLEMAAASLSDNLLAGEDYEEGHRAAFDHASRYLQELEALKSPVLVMNVADELFDATSRIDEHLRNGERRDYPQWGHGFLELHAPDVAREVLAFLDGDYSLRRSAWRIR